MASAGKQEQRRRAAAFEGMFPVVLVQDRYFGLYSGGLWLAIAMGDAPADDVELEPSRASFCLDDGPNGADEVALAFWGAKPVWIEAADTPDGALEKLRAYL